MSIALIGPKQYDFQDLVCIRYLLQFYKKERVHFFIEPNGGEDAQLNYIDNTGQILQFEIQVKGSKDPLNIKNIAECLVHFPAYKNSNFLLERLISNKNSRLLLVMTGRATDEIQKFLFKGDWDGSIHSKTKFTKIDARQILDAIKDHITSLQTSNRNEKRKEHVNKFITKVDENEVKESLSRLIVLDQVNNDLLNDACRKILRKDFYIPDDMFNNVIAGLSMLIKKGKLSQENVIPSFLKKLDDNCILSVRPKKYILRNQESDWIEELDKNRVLLLSGKPRVGKSNTAKWIASEYQTEGYAILLTKHIDEAERFLLDSVRTPRLVVLDDPLGGIHSVNKPYEKLSVLKKIISDLKQNRKLIVSQGQERLLEITESESLIDAKLGSNSWFDLSITSNEFLIRYWESLKEEFKISDHIYFMIRDEIDRNNLYIEPGCLAYIASEHKEIIEFSNVTQVLRFARKTAIDLGHALVEDGCKDVLIGLALITSHLDPVQEKELAFSLKNKEDKMYACSDYLGTSISFGCNNHNEIHKSPEYKEIYELYEKDSEMLGLLELRRMVEFDDMDQITFTHPFYRAAAESLINLNIRGAFNKIESHLRNGIFCLSPITARASARNLHWIYEKLKRSDDKNKIIELAKDGLKSIYPSVRDLCFKFLIDHLDSFDPKYQLEQSSWIYKVNGDNLNSLEWKDGQPWYPNGQSVFCQLDFFKTSDDDAAIRILYDIDNNIVRLISPKDAYDLLIYFEHKPEDLSHNIASRILSVNEGLIRAFAAKLWIKVNRKNDSEILERIFRDKHPSVAASVFNSSIWSWNEFSAKRKSEIFTGLKIFANQPVLAFALIDDLVVFEREYAMGENPPWEIFAELLSIVLTSIPSNSNINYPRLYKVVDEATSILNSDSILSIIDSWIALIMKVAENKNPGEYELGVIDILFKITRLDSNAREGRVKKILSIYGTGAIVNLLSNLMKYWVNMTMLEKDVVMDLINSDRIDKYWLQSAVLTSTKAPRELLELIIDDYSSEHLSVEDILNLPPKLLSSALKIHIDYPLDYSNENIWNGVVDSILCIPSHSLFQSSFKYALNKGNKEFLCNVINGLGEKHAKVLFGIMLKRVVESNPEYMHEVWSALFEMVKKTEVKSEWIKLIALNAQVIFDDLFEVKKMIPNSYVHEFLKYFTSDICILRELYRIKEDNDIGLLQNHELNKIKNEAITFFENNEISHYSTCDRAKRILIDIGLTGDDTYFIDDRREYLTNKKIVLINKSDTKPEKLINWIF